MTPINVLVVFYSRRGKSEALALAAGVGAIQGRANIRLRRLADLADPEMIQADAAWSENAARMGKDYIAPREIDAQWADVLILSAPRDRTEEMEQYLDSAHEAIQGKTGAVLGTFAGKAAAAGLAIVPPAEATTDAAVATAYGRRAIEAARVAKAGSAGASPAAGD
jgi:NAD(P)H dehydrogenase (quinone)